MIFTHEQIVKIAKDNSAPWILKALEDYEKKVERYPEGSSNPRILEYWKHTDYNPKTDKESYCAAAMCTWLEECGFESPHDPAAISFEKLPQLKNFKPGALMLFHRDGAEEWMRHITIGIFHDELNGVYYCLGGNQGGKVCIRPYGDHKLDSIHWPKKNLE